MLVNALIPPGLVWQPAMPPAAVLALTAAAGLAAVWSAWRTWRASPWVTSASLILRAGVIAAVAAVLMGPGQTRATPSAKDRPTLTLMLDTSGSMLTRDVEGSSRFAWAARRWLDAATLRTLRQHFDVRLLGFDDSTHDLNPWSLTREPEQVAVGDRSHIARGVRQAVGMTGRGGTLVVFSDGRDSEGGSLEAAGRAASAGGVRVYGVALGGWTLARDVSVEAWPAQPFLFKGEPGGVRVAVRQQGAAGETVRVRLELIDPPTPPAGERAAAEREVPMTGPEATLTLPVRHDEPGVYAYRVVARAVAGEAERGNNEARVYVEVVPERVRVLVLEGQPFWDTKFLAQSLRRDERIALEQVTQMTPTRRESLISRGDNERGEGGGEGGEVRGAFEAPTTAADWSRWDVVILGRRVERLLSDESAEALAAWVEGGGRVILARGRAVDAASGVAGAVRAMEPVVWGAGRLEDARPQAVAGGEWLGGLGEVTLPAVERVERERAGARVWARVTGRVTASGAGWDEVTQPLVVEMGYGRGRVAAVLGEGLWRWSLRDREAGFDAFWSGLVRRVVMSGDGVPGREVSLRLSDRNPAVGEAVTLDVSVRGGRAAAGEPRVRVEAVGEGGGEGGGDAVDVAMHPTGAGRWRGQIVPERSGAHRVTTSVDRRTEGDDADEIASASAALHVRGVDRERLDTAADPAAIAAMTRAGGGRLLDPARPEALLELARREVASLEPGPPRVVPLWHRAWVLAAIGLLAGAEWIVRRAGGLA